MIWEDCKGAQQIRTASGTAYRLVESQEQIATLGYVDTFAEQALLEEMLESTKPAYRFTTDGFHYLLTTPSATHHLNGAPVSAAFMNRAFFTAALIRKLHSLNRLIIDGYFGIRLMPNPSKIKSAPNTPCFVWITNLRKLFSCSPHLLKTLAHLQDYAATQQFGTAMHNAGVAVFEYISARDPQQGLCVGLFSPAAFTQKTPTEMMAWLCEVSASEVAFKQRDNAEVFRFGLENFMVNGELPLPVG